MAILKMREIRYMTPEQRVSQLKKLRRQLSHLRATIATGGSLEKPSQVKETKRTIARILTVMKENGEID
ncbi:MAG: 50S ribosomal protein L29 [Candidatus Heimdallarchaeota archaeon]|nr:50S ribosomal protein L29 [Candidatus Heimdallarchaeota archaeon]